MSTMLRDLLGLTEEEMAGLGEALESGAEVLVTVPPRPLERWEDRAILTNRAALLRKLAAKLEVTP